MKQLLVSCAVSIGVFAASWHTVAFIFQAKGPHTWFDAHTSLCRLHNLIDELRNEEGSLPSSERVNMMIETTSRTDLNQGIFDNPHKADYLLHHLAHEISEDRLLRLWNAPPIYVKDENLPDGFGFYLAGEDRVSLTAGGDADDINSWDQSSYGYYFRRLQRQRALRNTAIAIIPALLVFAFVVTKDGWHKKQMANLKGSCE